jgi:hypothetical protein
MPLLATHNDLAIRSIRLSTETFPRTPFQTGVSFLVNRVPALGVTSTMNGPKQPSPYAPNMKFTLQLQACIKTHNVRVQQALIANYFLTTEDNRYFSLLIQKQIRLASEPERFCGPNRFLSEPQTKHS